MIIEQEMHPKLTAALKAHGKLGLYAYAPSPTKEVLELTHNSSVHGVLSMGTPVQLRSEEALITYFSNPFTMNQTAELLGSGRETIRKGLVTALTTRHLQLDSVYQSFYPLADIVHVHHKYLPPEHSLLIAGNIGTRIIELIEKGADFDQIQYLLNLDSKNLTKSLRMMRTFGIDVPPIPHSAIENSWVLENLHSESMTDKDVQFYLNRVTHGIYDLDRLSGDRVLLPITPTAKEMGYHISGKNAKEFIEVVLAKVPISPEFETGIQNGIPKRYRFGVTWHEDRVKEAIKEAKKLDQYLKSKVEQKSGTPLIDSELPTTYQIIKNKGVLRVGTVLLEIGIRPESADYRVVREAITHNGFQGNTYLYKNMFMVAEDSRHNLQEYAKRVLGIVPAITAQ